MDFESEDVAKKVLDSVKLDNGKWIDARREGSTIKCVANADTVGGLLHTSEDFLSCVALAEKMIRKG